MDRETLIAFVRETHRLAGETDVVDRAKAGRKVTPATAKDYERVGRSRLDLADASGGRLMAGVSRQSWDHHRAALRHEAARLFAAHRSACDAAQRSQDLPAAEKHARASRAALSAYTAVSEAERPPNRSAPRKSKRKSLPKGPDWQERAWEAATAAMRPAVACGWVGARPNEIELGVVLERTFTECGEAIRVTIRGAKVTERSGQPERTLLISVHSPEGRALFSAIPKGEFRTEVRRGAKRINADWCNRIRPRMGGKPSAYSLRHQFAANLKAAGLSPVEIAKALGHLSVKSQKRYGSRSQGQGGGLALLEAEAPREVRTGPEADAIFDDPTPAP
jgi:integrase